MIYLQWLRKEAKISQNDLAKKLGVSRTTISMWENGSSLPTYETLSMLSNIFGESIDLIIQPIAVWSKEENEEYNALTSKKEKLLFLEENGIPHYLVKYYHTEKSFSGAVKSTKIPVLGYVRGGNPITAYEEIIGYEEITEKMMESGEYFGLIVTGDSMEPRFTEGDTVIVRKQSFADTGNIVVAMIGEENATIKKIVKDDKGIILQPLNPSYKPLFFSKEDILSMPVTVLGKVVELRAKF